MPFRLIPALAVNRRGKGVDSRSILSAAYPAVNGSGKTTMALELLSAAYPAVNMVSSSH